jgi:DNA-binding MarR family transcriptional regulator
MIPASDLTDDPAAKVSVSGVDAAVLGILRAAAACEELVGRILKREGLSRPQFNVLRVLGDVGDEGLPCLEIGSRMVTRVPDVTRLVDRLVEQGYVRRERSVSDRRIVRVRLLPKGSFVLDRARPAVDEAMARTLGRLGCDRLSDLAALLDDAQSFLEERLGA